MARLDLAYMAFGDWIEFSEKNSTPQEVIEQTIAVQQRLLAAQIVARTTVPGATEQVVIEVFRQLHAVATAAVENQTPPPQSDSENR
jgi:hypothetical protein